MAVHKLIAAFLAFSAFLSVQAFSNFQLRGYYLPGASKPIGGPRTTTTLAPGVTPATAFPDAFFLSVVNAYRSDHNASALTTDATLKSKAAACAQGYATAGIASGSEPTTYCADTGTGIDYYYSGGTSNLNVMEMITTWYDEKCSGSYDYTAPSVTSTSTQHFTQLVWKATTKVGCAFSSSTNSKATTQYITVCIFSPPGNQAPNGRNTQFLANVVASAEACSSTGTTTAATVGR